MGSRLRACIRSGGFFEVERIGKPVGGRHLATYSGTTTYFHNSDWLWLEYASIHYCTVRETSVVREPAFEVPVTVIPYEPAGVPEAVTPEPPEDEDPPPHEPM
jgi:hypothetical protein